jgi:hypothetical protein
MVQLKVLEKQEQVKPKFGSWKEIIQIRAGSGGKIDKPLPKLTKRQKKHKLIKLEMKKDIQSIIREYFENLYSIKWNM